MLYQWLAELFSEKFSKSYPQINMLLINLKKQINQLF